jgi:hypothetical protein
MVDRTSKIAPAAVLAKVLTLVFGAAIGIGPGSTGFMRAGQPNEYIFSSYPKGYQLKSKHKQIVKLSSFQNKSSQL